MDFETKIKAQLSIESALLNHDTFLKRFHSHRHSLELQRYRVLSGITALALIFVLGLFTVNQLNNEYTPGYFEEYYVETAGINEELFEEFVLYLVNESHDILTTMEFLTEIGYEPITNWMEDKL